MREGPQLRRATESSRPGRSPEQWRPSQRALVIASLVRCPGPVPGKPGRL